ncbi:hypothetical protein TNCV_2371991 [Trichonephila clavipes]|nr:hypothetical protein TNCV_2371991 [Trichonephila clavipes]
MLSLEEVVTGWSNMPKRCVRRKQGKELRTRANIKRFVNTVTWRMRNILDDPQHLILPSRVHFFSSSLLFTPVGSHSQWTHFFICFTRTTQFQGNDDNSFF